MQDTGQILIDGGFAEPVFEAQTVFRAVMDAMARPGTIHQVETSAKPPVALDLGAAAVILTLCDHDTPVWLDPKLPHRDRIAAWIGFQTGAPLVQAHDKAEFALVADMASMPLLAEFAQGTQEYPDRSATLILCVDALTGDAAMTLAGPGIASVITIAPMPLPGNFVEQWAANAALYPRGVDLILVGPEGILALPRTARLKAS